MQAAKKFRKKYSFEHIKHFKKNLSSSSRGRRGHTHKNPFSWPIYIFSKEVINIYILLMLNEKSKAFRAIIATTMSNFVNGVFLQILQDCGMIYRNHSVKKAKFYFNSSKFKDFKKCSLGSRIPATQFSRSELSNYALTFVSRLSRW